MAVCNEEFIKNYVKIESALKGLLLGLEVQQSDLLLTNILTEPDIKKIHAFMFDIGQKIANQAKDPKTFTPQDIGNIIQAINLITKQENKQASISYPLSKVRKLLNVSYEDAKREMDSLDYPERE